MRSILIITTFLLVPLLVGAQTATSSLSSTLQSLLTSPSLTTEQKQEMESLQNQAIKLLSPKSIRQNAIGDYLKVQISPQNPKPGETVRVTAESFLSDLSKATISWSVNGKVIERGIGKTAFSFQTGASGATTRLGILILTNDGEEIFKEYGFNPLGLTILWEADTYTPPFYKGKPLATYQSRIRAIAVPDSANAKGAFDAGALSYVWRQNGYAVSGASGFGKNSFTFTAPRPYEQMKIGVSASPIDNSASSEFNVSLPMAQPFILFYKDDPLLGVRYEEPLGKEFNLAQKDLAIRAEPYFFSNERGDVSLFSSTWELNGKPVANQSRTIALKNTEGVAAGSASLSFGMTGTRKTFQAASQSLRIKFNPEESAAPSF